MMIVMMRQLTHIYIYMYIYIHIIIQCVYVYIYVIVRSIYKLQYVGLIRQRKKKRGHVGCLLAVLIHPRIHGFRKMWNPQELDGL